VEGAQNCNKKSRVALLRQPGCLRLETRGFPSSPCDEFGFFCIQVAKIKNNFIMRQRWYWHMRYVIRPEHNDVVLQKSYIAATVWGIKGKQ
jgi:hypothetical protein